MKHVAVVITARASLARVHTVLEYLSYHCLVTIVLAGSAALAKYGDVQADLPFASGHVRRCTAFEPHGKDGAAAYTGHLTTELAQLFRLIEPTDVVVIADRYETLAVSIAASYQGIRLIHLLGGERSGNIDDKVRFANTALADVHCVATREAAGALFPRYAQVTGCPSVDLALRAEMPSEEYLDEHGIGELQTDLENYAVVLFHPDGEEIAECIRLSLAALIGRKLSTIYWFWPNIDPGAERIEKAVRAAIAEAKPGFRFYRHMPAKYFLGLVKNAKVLIGNSSVGVREAGILGTPVVNIGNRQENRARSRNVIDWSPDSLRSFVELVGHQIGHGPYEPDFLYGTGNSGEKIAKIILEQS